MKVRALRTWRNPVGDGANRTRSITREYSKRELEAFLPWTVQSRLVTSVTTIVVTSGSRPCVASPTIDVSIYMREDIAGKKVVPTATRAYCLLSCPGKVCHDGSQILARG